MDSRNCCASGEPDPVNRWPQVHTMTAMGKLHLAGRMILSPISAISLDPSAQMCAEPLDTAIACLQRETESYKRDMELLERFRIPPPDKHPPTLPVRMRGRVGVRELQDKKQQGELANRLTVRRERRGARKRKIVHEGRRTLRNQKKRRRIARDESEDRKEDRGRKRKVEDDTSMTSTMTPHPKRCRISNDADPSISEPATKNKEMSEKLPPDEHLPSTRRQQLISVPTIGDGRCFFRAVTICQDRNLQRAERYFNGTPKHLHLKIEETIAADELRSKTVGYMLDNLSRYEGLDERLISADLPSTVSYSSMEDRISSMGRSTEMVGELEIAATAEYLRRPVHVFVGPSVLKFGIEYQDSNPIEVKYSNVSEDAGHYEALVTSTLLENKEEPITLPLASLIKDTFAKPSHTKSNPIEVKYSTVTEDAGQYEALVTSTLLENKEEPIILSLASLIKDPFAKPSHTNSDIVTSRAHQEYHMVNESTRPISVDIEDSEYYDTFATSTAVKNDELEPALFSRITHTAAKTNDNVSHASGSNSKLYESLFSLVTRPDAFTSFHSDIVKSSPHTNQAVTKEDHLHNLCEEDR